MFIRSNSIEFMVIVVAINDLTIVGNSVMFMESVKWELELVLKSWTWARFTGFLVVMHPTWTTLTHPLTCPDLMHHPD